jgi:ABC-2 type transport system permease protein
MSTPETNFSAAGATVDDSQQPTTSATKRKTSIVNTLILLTRRELWEHRALWIAPLVVAALLIAGALVAAVTVRMESVDWDPPPAGLSHDALIQYSLSKDMEMQYAVGAPLYLVTIIVITFYLLDCLFAERKDRTILFWKSLPVSDGITVASKFLVALLVVPLGVYLLALLSSLVLSAIFGIRLAFAHVPPNSFVWDTVGWLKVQALTALSLFTTLLWYAPLAGYLLLVSAWARRNVFLWAILPPLVTMLVERMTLGTHFIADLIKYRTLGIPGGRSLHSAIHSAVANVHDSSMSVQSELLQIGQAFLNLDLWIGIAVAVAFAFAAVRIRRYRDDT